MRAPSSHLALLLVLLPALSCAVELPLEASFDGISFSPFGLIEGDLSPTPGSLSLVRSAEQVNAKLQDQLRTLAGGDGFFSVRIKGSGKQDAGHLMASVRAACLFQEGPVKELVTLYADDKGRLLSFDYALDHPYDSCFPTEEDVLFSSAVGVSLAFPAAGPMVINIDTVFESDSRSKSRKRVDSEDTGPMSRQFGNMPGQEDDEADDERGVQRPEQPPQHGKTWWEKNWLTVAAGGMVVVNLLGNIMKAQGPPGAAPGAVAAPGAGAGAARRQ